MRTDLLQHFPWYKNRPMAGKVRLLEEIGRGGMGMVYGGWHTELEIPVAVKLLLPSAGATEELIQRFRREARLCAELDEPNLLRVLDFGVEGTVAYIVMELVAGKGFDCVVEAAGALMEAEVVTVLRDVGQALLALQRHGVIHRDLKPSNLLLRASDGRIKVADLGLAKQLGAQEAYRTQQLLGTPAFMSPEQANDSSNVTGTSDLFSLGVTAFVLLTGRVPFAGDSVLQTLHNICNQPLPDPRAFGVDVSEGTVAVLRHLTQKDPAARPQTVEQMLEQLPARSVPFRPTILKAAAPDFVVRLPTQEVDPQVLSVVDHQAPTLYQPGPVAGHSRQAEAPPLTLLFCQCLQNDFITPLRKGEPVPNKMHIGWREAERIMGRDPAKGPLVTAVSACARAEHVRIIYIRDWHTPDDFRQQPELAFFGNHCLKGTHGARFIDVLEAFSRDRVRASVVDATRINDFEDTPIQEVIGNLIGNHPPEVIPVGVIGVWTNIKVHYLLYDLKTRAHLHNLATCSSLVASSDRIQHEHTLQHLEQVLNVKVFHDIEDFLAFLGVQS